MHPGQEELKTLMKKGVSAMWTITIDGGVVALHVGIKC
jgi:hypothetical protein